MKSVAALRDRYPWPPAPPDVPPDPQSFLRESTGELLRRYLSPETRCVIELGSWLGASTRLILDAAPNAVVIAIDHWKGPTSIHRPHLARFRNKLPTLYETFLTNCWEYRDRLTPIRAKTVDGLHVCHAAGIAPDLVFIDADHSYRGVWDDVSTAVRLFPGAKIVGDDWQATAKHCALRKAVKRLAKRLGFEIESHGNGWGFVKP